VSRRGDVAAPTAELDHYHQELMTAVVDRAEKAGKQVTPLILPTNNPLFAVIQTAKNLQVQELIMGASNTYTADEQLEQIAFYWISVHDGRTEPLTVRILSSSRDVYLDLGGGNRIPKMGERQARSVAQLRSAGVGISSALLVHRNDAESSDLFAAVLTMLDPQVDLTLVAVAAQGQVSSDRDWVHQDLELARQLKRKLEYDSRPNGDPTAQIVRLAQERKFDLIIIGRSAEPTPQEAAPLDIDAIVRHAPCRVCLVSPPVIPHEVDK
jgi:nucleotide-binding universal stress UspA family protein